MGLKSIKEKYKKLTTALGGEAKIKPRVNNTLRTARQKEEDERASKNVAKPYTVYKGRKLFDGVGAGLREQERNRLPHKTSMKRITKRKKKQPLVEQMRWAYKNRSVR